MEAEDVINLFDSCWFNQQFFKKSSDTPTSSTQKRNPDRQIHENFPQAEISSQLTIHTRSKSEQTITGHMNWGNFSPNSVLPAPPHLETVLSGIEGKVEFQGTPETGSAKSSTHEKKKKKKEKRKTLAMRGWSKSLSELEFEELKGFMDLGFVFSEEDKRDSTLVEIIPGLQRLGKKRNGIEEEEEEEEKKNSSGPHDEPASSVVVIKRPYLSEAWEAFERRKKEEPLMNWKVPSVKNEIGMKDSLKWWAHTVASTVR